MYHNFKLSCNKREKVGFCTVMGYTTQEFYDQYGRGLELECVAGEEGLRRRISVPEVHRPGLTLTGYLKSHSYRRILVFGKVEIEYLRDLEPELRIERLDPILSSQTPAVIVARRFVPPPELLDLCRQRGIPLFRTPMVTARLITKAIVLLTDEFAPSLTCHGTLVEVFGVGVLIQGESSVGKSEAALGLIERGHRLISDDVVKIKRREEGRLEGYGVELTRHHMEIRGIGIINVASLYGAICVRNRKVIDLVVRLEVWNDETYYDRVGSDEQTVEILGSDLPFHLLPVKPGRDVVLLLETIALNHRLRQMGMNTAREFQSRLVAAISRKR